MWISHLDITMFNRCPQIMPGDNVELICELHWDVAADIGTRFTIREGNKTSKRVLLAHLLFTN